MTLSKLAAAWKAKRIRATVKEYVRSLEDSGIPTDEGSILGGIQLFDNDVLMPDGFNLEDKN